MYIFAGTAGVIKLFQPRERFVKMLKKVSLVILFAMSAALLHAAPWMSHNSRRAPKTLVVVGNYSTPRLMASTIKALTSQPYLIIDGKENKYYMVLSKVTVQVPPEKLDVYINQLNPRRMVIIGDERFVTLPQEQMLRKINLKRIPIVRIYGGDWGRIAEELDDLLNIGNLSREFRRNYYEQFMSDPRLRDPAKQDAPAAPAAPAEAAPAADDDAPVAEPVELPAN